MDPAAAIAANREGRLLPAKRWDGVRQGCDICTSIVIDLVQWFGIFRASVGAFAISPISPTAASSSSMVNSRCRAERHEAITRESSKRIDVAQHLLWNSLRGTRASIGSAH